MHALIVLGGDAPGAALLRRCAQEADFVIAADRGLACFEPAGIEPDLLVGDMDSVPPQVLARYADHLPLRRLNCIKDDTDGVDAMDEAIVRGANRITFLGALGGRLDHALANLMLLVRAAQRGVFARILDEHVSIVRVDGECVIENAVGDTVSVLPLGSAQGVTLTGFFYPLENHTLTSAHPLGVSNVVTQERAVVRAETGDLLVFHHRGGV